MDGIVHNDVVYTSIIIPAKKVECKFAFNLGREGKKLLTRLLRSYTLQIMTDGYQLITATYKGYKMIENVADNQILLYDLSSDYVELIYINEIKTVEILLD